MSAGDNLPVILVSAVDAATASELITELMDDSTEPQCNGVGGGQSEEEEEGAVWRLRNKYYSAAVRLRALPDAAAPPPPAPAPPPPPAPAPPPPPAPAPGDVQAHIIYLTEDECSDCSACARRLAAAGEGVARGGVRLVAARVGAGGEGGAALAAWARAQRYELVPLRAPPAGAGAGAGAGEGDEDEDEDGDEDEDEFPAARGVARLREALHAHVWPNMRRAGAAAAPPAPLSMPTGDSSAESSDSEWGAWTAAGDGDEDEDEDQDEDEAGAVRRAELFAEALALLPARGGGGGGAGGGGGGGAGDEERAARRLHAEQLVAAFCRALGHELRPPAPPGGEGGGQ